MIGDQSPSVLHYLDILFYLKITRRNLQQHNEVNYFWVPNRQMFVDVILLNMSLDLIL